MNQAWATRPLGEIFEIGAGKTMSKAAREGPGKVPFLRTSNVLWDEIDLTELDEMAIDAAELRQKSLAPGDLLVCEGGEIGRAAVWTGATTPMTFQNHLHRLRPSKPGIEPRFYVYFLQSAFTQLGLFAGAGNKTTIPNLSRNQLAALEVPEPSPQEQENIARVLGAVRMGVKAHSRSVATAGDLKRTAMRELFTRGLRGELQKESEVGPVPQSWEVRCLGDDHEIAGGGTPLRSVPAYWVGGTIPWVKTAEVNYSVIMSTSEHITQEGLDNSSARLLPPGTLLIAMFGQGVTRGRVAILGIEASCNQACAAVRPRNDRISTRFLYHLLTSKYDDLRQLAHGGQQQNLNIDIVRNFRVAVPSTTGEQEEIVAILDAIDAKIDLHRRKRAVLEELFKSLLHKLMTGEIRVADLDLSALLALEEARS